MNIEDVRNYCLSLKGTSESLPFGNDTLVFKVLDKIFLILPLSNYIAFNVKCDPEKAVRLREEYPCVQPGYHMNKKHWNTITVDGNVSDKQLYEWIRDSYNLILDSLPKAKKLSLQKM